MSGKKSKSFITFPQDAQELVEAMGLPEKSPQPTDGFDGALSEPQEAANDEGHFPPRFFKLGAPQLHSHSWPHYLAFAVPGCQLSFPEIPPGLMRRNEV